VLGDVSTMSVVTTEKNDDVDDDGFRCAEG
jgi:hypothetical protein